jgi:DNA-binding GntR family transcriptional regulator
VSEVYTSGDGTTPQQHAGNYLREQILTGRFPVGMRLKSQEIAQKLGFSRMPVRDALQQLHSEGLVSIRPNRGAIVATLTGDEIRELFEIRATLEGLAARYCFDSMTEEKIVRFEALFASMSRETGDTQRWFDLHENFHDAFAEASGRPRLHLQIRNARRAVLPYVRQYIVTYNHMEMPNSGHDVLISILRHGNADLMEEAMRSHIFAAADGVANFLREHNCSSSPN